MIENLAAGHRAGLPLRNAVFQHHEENDASGLANHDFSRFNDNHHSIAFLQLQIFGACTRNKTFDGVIADLDCYVRHDVA